MHRRRLLALSGALLTGAFAGCSAQTPQPNTEPSTPEVDPDLDTSTLDTLVNDTNSFSMDLYRRLATDASGENVFVSPISVSTTLAMAIAGARGATRSQMREALRYTLEEQQLHRAFNALQRTLNERGTELDTDSLPEIYNEEDDPKPFELDLVNAVWGQKGFPFEDDYLQILDDHYNGGLQEVDYRTDYQGARATINDWIAERTEDRIEELLPEGSLDSLTRLVLTNAVYFHANWRYPFDTKNTESQPFSAIDGTSTDVPMMQTNERIPYGEIDGAKAIDLPYLGGEVSMLLVLPSAGSFESFEKNFDVDHLRRLIDALETRDVDITIPRFEFSTGSKLKPVLETLGMEAPFDPEAADFSGMVDTDSIDENLYLSNVYHDTFVAVDETGTEAAAATGAVLGYTSAPVVDFEFVADRPFLLAIRDRPTGTVLFLGRVVDAGAAQ